MSAGVIYARVSADLKRAVDDYAGRREVTLTSAVADLLSRGLEAVANGRSSAQLERSVADLQVELAKRERDLAQEKTRAAGVEERERALTAAMQEWQAVRVGTCPWQGCGVAVTATDLVMRRGCRNGHPLGHLLEQVAKVPGMDSNQLLIAIAVLGLVLVAVTMGRK